MSTISENTSFMNNTIANIQEQLENLILSLNNINNECNKDNITLYNVVCDNTVGFKDDNIEIQTMINHIINYRNTGDLYYLIQFLIGFYNNPYTSCRNDNNIRNYIYNKLFNKGEDENEL